MLEPLKNRWTILLIVIACAHVTTAVINFKNCQGPIDLGGTEKRGDMQNCCIKEHHFENESHAWILKKSIIRDTNFTHCTFHDTNRRTQSFNGSTWENVIFQNCLFTSPNGRTAKDKMTTIMFEHVSFSNVQFNNCTFDASTDVIFSQFAFRLVSFRKCTFNGRFINRLGSLWRVRFEQSSFGTNNTRASLTTRHPGDIFFTQVTMQQVQFWNNRGGTNDVSISAADVTELDIGHVTFGGFRCHRLDTTGADILEKCMKKDQCQSLGLAPALFTDTLMYNSTFLNGVFCDGAVFRRLYVRHVAVENMFNLSSTDVEKLTVDNIHPVNVNTSSEFSLAEAKVKKGRVVSNIFLKSISLAGASFLESVHFFSVNLSMKSVNVKETTFSQEKIDGQCCSTGCFGRGCFCNLTLPMIRECPKGDATVWLQAEKKSCFPARANLWTMDARHQQGRYVRMENVRVGDMAAGGSDKSFGPVFFFGHRDGNAIAQFVKLSVRVDNSTSLSLRLSGGHFLSVRGEGNIPARRVRVGHGLRTIYGYAVVEHVGVCVERGLYAPTTMTGEMVVDGVVVSCFTEFVNERAGMALLAPLRWMFRNGGAVGRRLVANFRVLDEASGELIAALSERLVASLRT